MNRLLAFLFVVLIFSACKKEEFDASNSNLKAINSLSEFDTEISSGVSMIFFHATWCSICKKQRPAVEATALDASLSFVKFRQVDTDDQKDIVNKYNVPGPPVIIMFKNGEERKRLVGSGHSQAELTDYLKAL